MVNEQQVRKIALFFFFTFLEEKTAFEAAHKAVSILKAKKAHFTSEQSAAQDVAVIAVMKRIFEQFKKSAPRGPASTEFDLMVDVPKGLDLAVWRRFHKLSPESETIAVVLSKILKYGDEAVAKGMNISLGTARYRIGKGIRTLGEIAKKA